MCIQWYKKKFQTVYNLFFFIVIYIYIILTNNNFIKQILSQLLN